MSKALALLFIQKVDSDPEFHRRFAAFSGNLPGLIDAAAQAGFAFSAADFYGALAERIAADYGELNEAELDAVNAGGGGSGGHQSQFWGSLSRPDAMNFTLVESPSVGSSSLSGNTAGTFGPTTMTVIQ
jgi:predicted ribosomally synthesized peptide with nif11-like leader